MPVQIGGRALDLLIALVERAGEVVSKADLFAKVWADVTVDEGSLRFPCAALRKALGDGKSGARYIVNAPGRGYSLRGARLARSAAQRRSIAGIRAGRAANSPRAAHQDGRPGRHDPPSVGRTCAASFRHCCRPGRHRQDHGRSHRRACADRRVRRRDLSSWISARCAIRAWWRARSPRHLGLMVSSDDPVPGLLAFLQERRMLLILDSCEHVIESLAAACRKHLQGGAAGPSAGHQP